MTEVLTTEVKGDPASLRATATWLSMANGSIHGAATQVYAARNESTSSWTGEAGSGFRSVMTNAAGKIDQIAGNATTLGSALSGHAADLDTVRSRMAMARQVATDGGLTVTATAIMPPGPAPAAPSALPKNATTEEKAAHKNSAAARADYIKKVKAYHQSGTIVAGARKTETTSQNNVLTTLKNVRLVSGTLAAMAGAGVEAASKFRTAQHSYDDFAERAIRVASNTKLSTTNRMRALQVAAKNNIKLRQTAQIIERDLWFKYTDRLPSWAKSTLTFTVAGKPQPPAPPGVRASSPPAASAGAKVAKVATKVGGKIPVVGLGFTAAGVGLDIAGGKDPGKAVVSGAAGLAGGIAAGAAVGAVVGGPLAPATVLVGGLVGGLLASGAAEAAWDFCSGK
ncbi:hypothetical protein EV193_102755 [Herbihabitans rhizosphaerae]|uniref:Uncharacterized protein n=1 Tax=Herbihabitans rhizosphaerae TaxID=1872711 RepID=A0A4Q7L3L5_9PSEU|nr:WXG100 family type VII secretion target [Herbihabitans rhizosphaerae]RZS43774.1 hypothetical protein EV193_102755 [Herbihabitans rhizosphaerae]